MGSRVGNDSDRYVRPRPEGGWEVVKERHERATAVRRTNAAAIEHGRKVVRGRKVVTHLGGGEVRSKTRHNRFAHSDTHGRRHESPARDRG